MKGPAIGPAATEPAMTIRPLFTAALCALALCACGKAADQAAETAAERAIEAETGGDVDVDIETQDGQQSVTVQTPEGEMRHTTGENVALPADFPKDIALPEGYTVLSVMTMGPAVSVVLRSPGSVADVYAQLRAEQARKGWKESVSMQGDQGSMLGFEKNKRGLLMNLRADLDGQTVVSLSLEAP